MVGLLAGQAVEYAGAEPWHGIADPLDRAQARWLLLNARFTLGQIAAEHGAVDELLAVFEASGDRWSYQLSWLGRIALLTADLDAALELHERAVRIADQHGFLPGAMYAETGLALVARRQGRFYDARRHLEHVRAWHGKAAYEPGNALIR